MTTSKAPRRTRGWLGALLAFVAAGPNCADARTDNGFDAQLTQTGDMLQVGVPLIALGLTFLLDPADDAEGQAGYASRFGLDAADFSMNGSPRHDLLLAIGRTELATFSLKYGVNEQRPNGKGQSFPSGHTSIAFAGAEFIRKQYGWGLGVPAYLSAGVVGWSRVESRNHWTHDVLAGAAIGIFSNHDTLEFGIPFGHGRLGQLSVAPALLAPRAYDFDAPDSRMEVLEQAQPQALPAPGLHFALRF